MNRNIVTFFQEYLKTLFFIAVLNAQTLFMQTTYVFIQITISTLWKSVEDREFQLEESIHNNIFLRWYYVWYQSCTRN